MARRKFPEVGSSRTSRSAPQRRVPEAIKGNAIELISCCEIEAMPAEGIVTFIEFLYRDPEEGC
jgi:hypothetical protein